MREFQIRTWLLLLCLLIEKYFSWKSYVSPRSSVFPVRNFLCRALKGSSSVSSSKSLFDEDVKYFNFANEDYKENGNVISLPLFVLNSVHFPTATSYYNIFEMKYRTMMFHISQKDDVFGIILSHPITGQLAQVGTMCKVIDRKLKDDGTQFIQVQGLKRFELVGIEKTSPYVTGAVVCNISDLINPEQSVTYRTMENEAYSLLKVHHRLIKLLTSANLSMPLEIKSYRPPFPSHSLQANRELSDSNRQSNFSFALASFVSLLNFGLTNMRIGFEETQLLLQTTNLFQRLEEEKKLLKLANEFLTQIAVKANVATQSQISLIEEFAFSDGFDDDLYPGFSTLEASMETTKTVNSANVDADEWGSSSLM